ncbi:MAG TPA: hypothetical protein VGG74_11910 [Kofleriaceae bacterium]|jgi:hypothetical protein
MTRAAFVLAVLAACAQPHVMTAHASPIDSYRAYGEYHPVAEDNAVVAKAASANPNAYPIRVFQEALPAGIELNGGTFGVAAGYHHRLLGKYAYSSGAEMSKDDLVAKVKKMCVAAGANAAVIMFELVPNDHQDRAQAIEAMLIDLHNDQPPAAAPAP